MGRIRAALLVVPIVALSACGLGGGGGADTLGVRVADSQIDVCEVGSCIIDMAVVVTNLSASSATSATPTIQVFGSSAVDPIPGGDCDAVLAPAGELGDSCTAFVSVTAPLETVITIRANAGLGFSGSTQFTFPD